jgi:hypothetical protein
LITQQQPGSNLSHTIGQQLEAAGFLRCLPQITGALAAQLSAQRDPAAITQQLQEAGFDSVMVTAQGSSLLALHRCTYHWFLLMDFLRLFWPQDVFEEKVAPIWYPAAAQLATATVCHVSFCMEHLPAQQQLTRPPALLDCLLGSARMTVVAATMWWWTGPVQHM